MRTQHALCEQQRHGSLVAALDGDVQRRARSAVHRSVHQPLSRVVQQQPVHLPTTQRHQQGRNQRKAGGGGACASRRAAQGVLSAAAQVTPAPALLRAARGSAHPQQVAALRGVQQLSLQRGILGGDHGSRAA
jgi:hypothetical protein